MLPGVRSVSLHPGAPQALKQGWLAASVQR